MSYKHWKLKNASFAFSLRLLAVQVPQRDRLRHGGRLARQLLVGGVGGVHGVGEARAADRASDAVELAAVGVLDGAERDVPAAKRGLRTPLPDAAAARRGHGRHPDGHGRLRRHGQDRH